MDKENHTPKGQHFLERIEKILFTPWTWFFASLCFFIPLSLQNFVSHSEFWSITSAQLLGQFNPESIVVYYRPVFYALLKTIYFFPLDNITHVQAARFIFGILASINIFLISHLVLQWTKSRKVALLYLIFLFTFHTFSYNFFRVRSDMLALFFVLLSLIYSNQQFIRKERLFQWPVVALLLLAFLSTPKSIFLIFSFSFYCIYLEAKSSSLKKRTGLIFAYFIIPLFFISLISIIFHIVGFSESNPFIFALIYFVNNIPTVLTNSGWINIAASFNINFLHFLFIALGYFFISKDQGNRFSKAPWILSISVTFFFLLYSEKWDYFFASLLPLMALPTILIFQELLKKIYYCFILIPLFITPFYMTHFTGWSFSNERQFTKIRELEKLVTQIPNSTYFDSTGILPRHSTLLSFFGPGDEASFPMTIRSVKERNPTFVFYTQKVSLGGEPMLLFLHRNYTEVQEDIWVTNERADQINMDGILSTPTSLDHLFIYDRRPFTRKLFQFR